MHTVTHSFIKTSTTAKKISFQSKEAIGKMLEFNRFGVIAWTLSIVTCFSGIVVGFFVDGSNQLEVTLAAAPTMATLVSILVVAPVRWIIGVGATAILINMLLMIF